MDVKLANAPETRFEARRSQAITSAHFGEPARQYRFAAALAGSLQDADMFTGLAMMFARLACDFGRLKRRKASTAFRRQTERSPSLGLPARPRQPVPAVQQGAVALTSFQTLIYKIIG
jgi:hypothetical protein